MESLVNFVVTDQNSLGGASIGIGYVSFYYPSHRKYHFISKGVTSAIFWILLSQLANPISVSESKTRPNADLILPLTENKVFDGAAGKDISLSEVLAGLLTRNGVLMQIVINAVLVRAGSRGRGR